MCAYSHSVHKKGAAGATPFINAMNQALGTGDLARLQAGGADVHLLLVTVNNHANALDVRTELAVGDTVGVADRTASDRVLAADCAYLRHG